MLIECQRKFITTNMSIGYSSCRLPNGNRRGIRDWCHTLPGRNSSILESMCSIARHHIKCNSSFKFSFLRPQRKIFSLRMHSVFVFLLFFVLFPFLVGMSASFSLICQFFFLSRLSLPRRCYFIFSFFWRPAWLTDTERMNRCQISNSFACMHFDHFTGRDSTPYSLRVARLSHLLSFPHGGFSVVLLFSPILVYLLIIIIIIIMIIILLLLFLLLSLTYYLLLLINWYYSFIFLFSF